MSIEQQVKDLIISRYGSMKAFSISIGLPNSTLDSIFRRGLHKASIDNVIKICAALSISADGLGEDRLIPYADIDGVVLSPPEVAHIKKYRALDERGKEAVDMILDQQYQSAIKEKAKPGLTGPSIAAAEAAYAQNYGTASNTPTAAPTSTSEGTA